MDLWIDSSMGISKDLEGKNPFSWSPIMRIFCILRPWLHLEAAVLCGVTSSAINWGVQTTALALGGFQFQSWNSNFQFQSWNSNPGSKSPQELSCAPSSKPLSWPKSCCAEIGWGSRYIHLLQVHHRKFGSKSQICINNHNSSIFSQW